MKITPPPPDEFREFEKWVKRLFDDDVVATNLVFQIFKGTHDKQTSGMGVIIEKDPPRKVPPIQNSEIASLSLYLLEKGLPMKRKRDNM